MLKNIQKIKFLEGSTLLIDKPLNWTSFDVINKVRGTLRHKYKVKKIKVGHSGTLDPLATGLLILCTGKYTKKLTEFTGLDKTYTGTIKLGGTTPSFDLETEIDQTFPTDHITKELIEESRKLFLGKIPQFPPMFSALKVDGVPLYKMARKGIKVEVKARDVIIHRFEITRFENNEIDFEVDCGKGTYLRSLAYDFGKALGSGGHLIALKRTKIGNFNLENAWNLEELVKEVDELVVN